MTKNHAENWSASTGFRRSEYARILQLMDREPTLVELGIFSVMWSEHCSYKSTRAHLKQAADQRRPG